MSKPNYQGFYNIVKNEAAKEATIYIYGVIGGFDFDKWEPINTANKFKDDFADVEASSELINVKINSPGGNVWDGLPIYNILKNSKKTIHTYVDGIAYSMASLIALSGDKIYGYGNSMLMFHNGLSYSYGNAKEMREAASTLDQYDEAISSIIEERLNISAEEVKEKYLNYSDNYFVGKKAKDLGFFDEIITSQNTDLPENLQQMSPQDLFKHYSAMNFKPFNEKKQNMSIKNISALTALLGVEALANNDNGTYLNEEQLQTINHSIVDATESLNAAQTAQQTAENETAEIQNKIVAALATAEVEGAENMTPEEGINALSTLITEYGKKDGDKPTNVPDGADNETKATNIIGGIDISAMMNN